MKIRIRKAQPYDFPEVHKLIKTFASFIQSPDKVMITPAQMHQDEAYFNCLVAECDEVLVGFATYFFSYHSWTGRAIYLDDLFVLENFRHNGIGSKLFEEVMKIGKMAGCYKMKWQVSNWNIKAQEFYKSRGAIIDDTEINCDLKL